MKRTYRGERSKLDAGVSVIVTQHIDAGAMAYPLSHEMAKALLRSWRPSTPPLLDAFDWGYRGSAPALLALAVLLDATDSLQVSKHAFEIFERVHVSAWGDQWEITSEAILRWIASSGALLGPSDADVVEFPSPADPTSTLMTMGEALADPVGWIIGMTVTESIHHDPALGKRIALARAELDQKIHAQGGAS